jgi:hypothetical protein
MPNIESWDILYIVEIGMLMQPVKDKITPNVDKVNAINFICFLMNNILLLNVK